MQRKEIEVEDLIKRSDARRIAKRIPQIIEPSVYDGTIMQIIGKHIDSIPSADRPQGEWIDEGRNLWGCSNCGMEIYSESERDRNEFHKWCSRCGARMKGADDEDNH